jgi:hypothetical protein
MFNAPFHRPQELSRHRLIRPERHHYPSTTPVIRAKRARADQGEMQMDRRGIFKVLAATLLAVPFVNRKAAAAEGDKKTHKLAIHVDQNDADVMKLALNNSRNAFELYKAKGEELAVEIVAYSQGLHMLRDDTSPVKDRIKSMAADMPKLAFSACGNTRAGMAKNESKVIPLLAQAKEVPAGVVRLVELQEAGWSYIRP